MNETLDLKQLETLARLYLDGRLTRLEEKELEYVLLRSDVSSPLLDEVREEMGVLTMLAAASARSRKTGEGKRARSRRRRFGVWLRLTGAAVAACAAIVFALTVTRGDAADETMVYVCIDGRELSADEAARVAAEAEARDMAMLAELMTEAKSESDEATKKIVEVQQMMHRDRALMRM